LIHVITSLNVIPFDIVSRHIIHFNYILSVDRSI
jgi:hypothetical protein